MQTILLSLRRCHRLIWLCAALLMLLTSSARADEPVSTPPLTIVGLEQWIQANHIQSIEQLLPTLPASYRDHYVLMFQSRSLQQSSYANPRALVFGTNARLIMTFNGDPTQVGFHALELLEFNPLSKSFQMAEFQFGERGANDDRTDIQRQVSFSQLNPPKCLQCHGAAPHPIWDTPPLWPGSYGEAYRERLSQNESEGLSAYFQQQASHPRYRWLSNVQLYQDATNFYPSQHAVYEGVETEPPNAQLTRLLAELNSEKILHQVTSQPRFAPYRYALLASVSANCNAIADDLLPAWRPMVQADFTKFVQQDVDALQRQLSRKAQRSATGHGAHDSVSSDNALRNFRYLAERGLGMDTSQWSMALEQNAPDFTTLTPVKPAWEQQLIARISADDQRILGEYYYRNYPDHNRYCRYLEARSQQQLAGTDQQWAIAGATPSAPRPDSGTTEQLARHTLQLCAACHTTGVAPAIDFDKPAVLADQLNQAYSIRGNLLQTIQYRLSELAGAERMPPNVNLSDTDIEALKTYLGKLAGH